MDDVIYDELKAVLDQAYNETGEPALAAGLVMAYATLRAANITAQGAWPGVVQAGITEPATAA